jgi:protein-L-isoaspartate(D-aspartate) O-methyltransferase
MLALAASASLVAASSVRGQSSDEDHWTLLSLMIRDIERRADEAGVRQDGYWRAALSAIASLDRERFVPADQREHAYEDKPLPIGFGQTISDPFIVAFMTSHLRLDRTSRVLEIGTGSGYQAAVLSQVAGEVWTIEIVEPLAKRAEAVLLDQGFNNIHVRAGDGFHGWSEAGPFDAIVVTAGAPKVPEPLIEQLKPGGRMVIPLGPKFWDEELYVITKARNGRLKRKSLGPVMFVDFTGEIRR